jgi:hypothetical protein
VQHLVELGAISLVDRVNPYLVAVLPTRVQQIRTRRVLAG